MKKTTLRITALAAASVLTLSLFTSCGSYRAGAVLLNANHITELSYKLSTFGRELFEGLTKHSAAAVPDAALTIEAARQLALDKLGLTFAEYTERSARLVGGRYVFKFTDDSAEYVCKINPFTGVILKTNIERRYESNGSTSAAIIGIDKARETALALFGLSGVSYTEREAKLSKDKYEFEFYYNGYEYECEINAYTGEVIESDIERKSDNGSTAAAVIGIDKAREAAIALFGLSNAAYTEREAKLDGGKYEFEFYYNGCEYECEINAYTGEVIESDIERKYDNGTSAAVIGIEKARQAALALFGLSNAAYTEREAKLDGGKYEFEFYYNGYEYECEINAYTGEVIESDIERK